MWFECCFRIRDEKPPGDIIRVMKKSITWLDRLRSRLTGQPAKVYATHRSAQADLHALEVQRARAVARLTEDIELIDRYVNPLERYMDGDRLLTPLGTILDRRSGKNLPLVWTSRGTGTGRAAAGR